MFGYDRRAPATCPRKVKPPFKRRWKYGDRPLLEFPPIFVRRRSSATARPSPPGRLFFVNNNGHAFALDADSGKIIWKRDVAELNASSPAYARGRLFIVNLDPGPGAGLDAKTGKTIWKRSLPGRSESSPIVVGNQVFFGCESGELFALNAKTGKTQWSTPLGGEIKAAPAYENGILYVGDYGGTCPRSRPERQDQVADRARSGPASASPAPSTRPRRSPSAASTAATTTAASTRFDAETGELAWTYSTGSYVYSGTAVADTKNTEPTVYVGSIDGNIYALNAKTGEPRWVESARRPGDRLAERGRQHRLRRRPSRGRRPAAAGCATAGRSSSTRPAPTCR